MKRNPFSIKNLKAVCKLTKNLKENNYELIHTHTPVGSVITRLARKFSKTKTKLIYTCHGFHFYKGCPYYYWLLFYPIEKYLMKYTDVLLVMNKEDYDFAKKHFKNTTIKFVNGVGFNKERIEHQTDEKELALFVKMAKIEKPRNIDDVPTYVLIPSFILSELKTAFKIGFVIYLPFLVIDIVISSVLVAMGMMFLPPTMIALPFKLIMFVMIDGWYLIVKSLVEGFAVIH